MSDYNSGRLLRSGNYYPPPPPQLRGPFGGPRGRALGPGHFRGPRPPFPRGFGHSQSFRGNPRGGGYQPHGFDRHHSPRQSYNPPGLNHRDSGSGAQLQGGRGRNTAAESAQLPTPGEISHASRDDHAPPDPQSRQGGSDVISTGAGGPTPEIRSVGGSEIPLDSRGFTDLNQLFLRSNNSKNVVKDKPSDMSSAAQRNFQTYSNMGTAGSRRSQGDAAPPTSLQALNVEDCDQLLTRMITLLAARRAEATQLETPADDTIRRMLDWSINNSDQSVLLRGNDRDHPHMFASTGINSQPPNSANTDTSANAHVTTASNTFVANRASHTYVANPNANNTTGPGQRHTEGTALPATHPSTQPSNQPSNRTVHFPGEYNHQDRRSVHQSSGAESGPIPGVPPEGNRNGTYQRHHDHGASRDGSASSQANEYTPVNRRRSRHHPRRALDYSSDEDINDLPRPSQSRSRRVVEQSRIYDQYRIPHKFRQRSSDGPALSSTFSEHGGVIPTASPGGMDAANTQRGSSMPTWYPPVTGIISLEEKFSGKREHYARFKSNTTMLLSQYPVGMRPMLLRSKLGEDDQNLVDYIEDTDITALEDMWSVLDVIYGQEGKMADYHCQQLLGLIRSRRPCHDLKTLQNLYNDLAKHYYAVARYSPSQIPMAEAVTLNISELLFGTSQKRVNRLRREKHYKPFDMTAILKIIKQHLDDLRDQEEAEKNNESRGYSYHYKAGYKKDKDSYHTSRYDKYKEGKHYSSHDSKHSSRDSKYSGSAASRSTSRESQYSQGKLKAHGYTAGVKPNNASNSTFAKKEKRSSTPLPPLNRGGRSKSPIRNQQDRRIETFRCTLCLADDHDVFKCLKFTPEEKYRACSDRHPRLCFKCFLPGHSSNYCRFSDQCRSDKCRPDILHHTSLCERFKRKD